MTESSLPRRSSPRLLHMYALTESLNTILSVVSGWVWGPPLLVLLVGTGLYYTVILKMLPVRFFYYGLRILTGREYAQGGRGEQSYFRALAMTLSATVGTGNIVGVASAILLGGPGALFWMWVTAVLGMATKYAEAVLAVRFRVETPHGFAGGPMYYIEKGLGQKWLGVLFAVFTLIAAFGIGNMVQIHSAASALETAPLEIPKLATAFAGALFAAVIILGGVKRIGLAATYLVPFMAVFYFLGTSYILMVNMRHILSAFSVIFQYAFQPLPLVVGGGIGILMQTIRSGVQRGLFSNEAGLGSTPIADASAKTNYPVRQGLVAMLGPFFDTLLICTMTGLAIVVAFQAHGEGLVESIIQSGTGELAMLQSYLPAFSDYLNSHPGQIWPAISDVFGKEAAGLKGVLTGAVFAYYMGPWGNAAVAISLSLFAFTTIIGWYYYSDRALVYLGGGALIPIYRYLYVFLVLVGGIIPSASFVWNFSDVANGLMAFPNLIAILLLSPLVVQETKEYFAKYPGRYSLLSQLYLLFMKILPKKYLSRFVGLLASWKAPHFVMLPALIAFSRVYRVKIDEAELSLADYKTMNSFFSRTLKDGARVLEEKENIVLSPVDGRVLDIGSLSEHKARVKGAEFSIEDLVHHGPFAQKLKDANYIVLYLAPGDYHRIHSPAKGKVIGYNYIPGTLYPVNPYTARRVQKLFSRNERLTTYLETEQGFMAIAKIGATSVGKIIVEYPQVPSTNRRNSSSREEFFSHGIAFDAGAELGRFEMGSTVVLLIEKNISELLHLQPGDLVKYGQPVALWKKNE